MRTLIELVMASAALSLMALGLTTLRALSTRVQRLTVWFEALDLERRREHPSREERRAAELTASRHFRTDERRTIEMPPPLLIDAARDTPTTRDPWGTPVARAADSAPETTPRAGASPVSRERQSPARVAYVDPPGSAEPMPAGPGFLAAGLSRPKSARPARSATMLGGIVASLAGEGSSTEGDDLGDRASDVDGGRTKVMARPDPAALAGPATAATLPSMPSPVRKMTCVTCSGRGMVATAQGRRACRACAGRGSMEERVERTAEHVR